MNDAQLVRFKVFVAGGSPASRRAVGNFKRMVGRLYGDAYQLEIIDIFAQPEQAEIHRIMAVPTVIRESPPPRVRVIGDLSVEEKLKAFLGVPG